MNQTLAIRNTLSLNNSNVIKASACFWGVALWLPISLTYLALGFTWLSLFMADDFKARWAKTRRHKVFLLTHLLFAWCVLSYLMHPGGSHALSTLFHLCVFNITLYAGLMLSPKEAKAAWYVFIATAACMLVVLGLELSVHSLPRLPGIRDVLDYSGNKSIRAALLIALTAAISFNFLLAIKSPRNKSHHFKKNQVSIFFSLSLFLSATLAIIFYFPSRTAMILLPLLALNGILHRRPNIKTLLGSLFLIAVLSTSAYFVSHNMHERIHEGKTNLVADIKAQRPTTSLGLRYHFYHFSLNKLAQNPVFGMGLGQWQSEWAKAQPGQFSTIANPHNDFLLFGSESGLPALLLLFAVYFAFFIDSFRRLTLRGSVASAAAITAGFTALFNAGMRDSVFALSLGFLMASAFSAMASTDKQSSLDD